MDDVLLPANWSSGDAFFFTAGGLGFKTRIGQIGYNGAYMARHCCDISSKEAELPAYTMKRRWAQQTRYTLRRMQRE